MLESLCINDGGEPYRFMVYRQPMAAVFHKWWDKRKSPTSSLMRYGPNVLGIGSAIAAGVLLNHLDKTNGGYLYGKSKNNGNCRISVIDRSPMTTEDMLPIAELMDQVGYILSRWGGATFDSCLRFLNESGRDCEKYENGKNPNFRCCSEDKTFWVIALS